METKHEHNGNSHKKENAQSENRFSDSPSDLYKKQMDMVFNFYSAYLNPFSDNNKKLWSNTTETASGAARKMFEPFNKMKMDGNSSGSFVSSMDKMVRQMAELNQGVFDTFYKQNGNITDLSSASEKYQQSFENSVAATKHIMNTLLESYNKGLEFTIEENKKILNAINNELNTMLQTNQQIWNNLANASREGNEHGSQETHKDHDRKHSHTAHTTVKHR